jgi:hypothetical protein
MRRDRLFFVLSLFGLLVLMFLLQEFSFSSTGIVSFVNRGSNVVIIKLQNSSVDLVLFDDFNIDVQKGDFVKFWGREDVYLGKKQIVVDRMICSKGS